MSNQEPSRLTNVSVRMNDVVVGIQCTVVIGRNLLVVLQHLGLGGNSPTISAKYTVFTDVTGPGRHISIGSSLHPCFADIDDFLFRWRELLRFRHIARDSS